MATNDNDILHRAISNGDYEIKKVFQTLSPSMDIQVASNFERLIYDINDFSDTETEKVMTEIKKTGKYKISKDNLAKIKKNFLSASLSIKEMGETITNFFTTSKSQQLIVDPHTAIGLGAISKLVDSEVSTVNTISLATAHPAKFPEATKFARNEEVELPMGLKHVMNEKENFSIMDNNIDIVKNYILKNI